MVTNFEKSNSELLQNVKEKIGSPVSVEVVLATLESLGIKSENVPEDFGYDDSWTLASDIFQKLAVKPLKVVRPENNLKSTEKPKKILLNSYLFVKQYFFSTSYLLAFAIQLTSIIVYGFSIYVYTGFNHVQSTVVVLGIIIGMIISGGFIQVIGNQVSKHFYLKDYRLVEQMTFFLLKKGVVFIFLTLLVIMVLNLIIPIYPYKTMLLIVSYAFGVGLLFLVFSPLHVIRNRKVIFLSTLAATLICLPFINNTSVNIYQLHFLGLFTAIGSVILFLIFYFKRKRKISISSNVTFQKGSLFYNNIYPFLYGFLINFFFFIDRIIAWSSNETSNFFLPVYYEKDYEIGMDLSIIFFLLLAGFLEHSNNSLFNFLNTEKKYTSLTNLKEYRKKILSLYIKNISVIFLASIPIYMVILYIFYGQWGYNYFFTEPLKSINIKIANIGVLGYLFLCFGMLNSSYLISMKRHEKVLKILVLACVLNISSGFIISRLFSYEDSVYGMLIASVAFTYLTLKENLNIYKNIDYYATL
ncbi:hypothetical protein ACQY1Q_12830 [Tenacibaculum sp. TC6]|uniref:hypothetical protein n=1 Tax=Tenacibaculum sp. TC6 TaxID=3423223 RepID=UPI003D35DAAD